MKTVYCLGNLAMEIDSLPVRLIPELEAAFPGVRFLHVDPTEDFVPADDSVIIDTIDGLKTVEMFSDLEQCVMHPAVSVHDYDLFLHLLLLMKLHKITTVVIIGVPKNMPLYRCQKEVIRLIRKHMRASESVWRSSCTGHRRG